MSTLGMVAFTCQFLDPYVLLTGVIVATNLDKSILDI